MSRYFKSVLLSIFLFFAFTSFVKADVFINEVMPNPKTDTRWVEIFNDATGDYSLKKHILVNTVIKDKDDYLLRCSEVNNDTVFNFADTDLVSSNGYLVVETPLLYLTGDLALYLVDCSYTSGSFDLNKYIKSSLFVPSTQQNEAVARIYDGSTNIELRNYDDSSNDTKGKNNTISPIILNASLDKSTYSAEEDITVNFDIKTVSLDSIKILINGTVVYEDNTLKPSYSITYTLNKDLVLSGANILRIYAEDNGVSSTKDLSFIVTSSTPLIHLNVLSNTLFSSSLPIEGVASSDTGVYKLELYSKKEGESNYTKVDELVYQSPYPKRKFFTFTFSPSGQGTYSIKVKAYDSNNLEEEQSINDLTYDTSAPKVLLKIDPSKPNGKQDYYTVPVEVELTPQEQSEGTLKIYYKWDKDDNWSLYTKKLKAPEGENTLYYKTVDSLGNDSGIAKKEIKVDTVKPEVIVQLSPEYPDGLNGFYLTEPEIKLSSYTDDIDKYEYSYDKDDWKTFKEPFKFSKPEKSIYFRAIDEAGNKSDVVEYNLKVGLEKPSPLRSLDYRLTKNNKLIIKWVDYKKSETYFYEIYKSGDDEIEPNKDYFYTAVPASLNYYVDTSLNPGKTYTYLLVKKTESGKSSDPVKFSVRIPGYLNLKNSRKVLGLSTSYLKKPPVSVYKNESIYIKDKGDVKGLSDSNINLARISFFFFLGVFLYLLLTYVSYNKHNAS